MLHPYHRQHCYDSRHGIGEVLFEREAVFMKRQLIAFLVLTLRITAVDRTQIAASQKEKSTEQAVADERISAPSPDTSSWKIYRNQKHGFELKYPEMWSVGASSGMGPDIITIGKPPRGVEPNASLTLAIQQNENPKKLSIEKWFAEQLRKLINTSPESTGHMTLGGQTAVFMDNTNSFGKERDIFTLLHETDVLSLSYKRRAEFDATYASMLASFRALK
jgi:hypothetical protein